MRRPRRGPGLSLDVAIVGAGIAGLTAAADLEARGLEVAVFEKARRPGGRLATVELAGGARADIGAQFFTVRSREFKAQVEDWLERRLVHVWYRGFREADSHPRYAATGGMSRLAERLAGGRTVMLSTRVTGVLAGPDGWTLSWPEAHGHRAGSAVARSVLLTAPRAQSAQVAQPVEIVGCDYDATVALAVELDAGAELPAPGAVRPGPETGWSWIADNVAKGVSERPSLTFHSTPGLARELRDQDDTRAVEELLERARHWTRGRKVLDAKMHRWRYATPVDVDPHGCAEPAPRLVLAGDAFAGPRVEGAFLSGRAAAERIAGA